jgi:hypothetical protein
MEISFFSPTRILKDNYIGAWPETSFSYRKLETQSMENRKLIYDNNPIHHTNLWYIKCTHSNLGMPLIAPHFVVLGNL